MASPEGLPNIGEYHDNVSSRLEALPGVESAIVFVNNEAGTRIAASVCFKGVWVTSAELDDTEAACFDLLSKLQDTDT
jgi:hypothetical protein